jgi:hypothetical protein
MRIPVATLEAASSFDGTEAQSERLEPTKEEHEGLIMVLQPGAKGIPVRGVEATDSHVIKQIPFP